MDSYRFSPHIKAFRIIREKSPHHNPNPYLLVTSQLSKMGVLSHKRKPALHSGSLHCPSQRVDYFLSRGTNLVIVLNRISSNGGELGGCKVAEKGPIQEEPPWGTTVNLPHLPPAQSSAFCSLPPFSPSFPLPSLPGTDCSYMASFWKKSQCEESPCDKTLAWCCLIQ